jgi:hypothetical protein
MIRCSKLLIPALTSVFLLLPPVSGAQKQSGTTVRILAARFLYFEDRTGADAVGGNALAELRKWREFAVVTDKKKADLLLVLSAGSPMGDKLIVSGGQTGTMQGGELHIDPFPNYNKSSPVRWASLTVIDARTRERLCSDAHQWGGVLTGCNSAGARLVRKLKRQTKR